MAQLVLVVNLEVAFAVNFLTDYAWLWATGSLAGIPSRHGRLALAASVGAVAAIIAYFPAGRLVASGPGVLLGTVVLLALAFWPAPRHQVMRAALWFLFSGGAMAGAVLLVSSRGFVLSRQSGPAGLFGLAGEGTMGGWEFPASLVAAGLLFTLVGVRYLWEAAVQRSRILPGLFGLRLRVGGKSAEMEALLDTGNSLRDPLGGRPVVVVEAEALRELLPPLVLEAVDAGWSALDRLPGSWASRCRLVPYRAVGRSSGVLLALVPDEMAARPPGRGTYHSVRALVGLAAEPLHPEGLYRALLPAAVGAEAAGGPPITWEDETG